MDCVRKEMILFKGILLPAANKSTHHGVIITALNIIKSGIYVVIRAKMANWVDVCDVRRIRGNVVIGSVCDGPRRAPGVVQSA